ncbi:MAG: UDP-N-acetylglucosamine 4,6-dehydratase (inverting) [Patescibacteria group bacterium]|jgi:UDP-N-acetylglucosamine 4,6-dehydratase
MNPELFKDKTVLITGGTGSFGKNYARFLLKNSELKKLIIFSRDELKQFHMQKEFKDERVRFFIGDVRDLPRLLRAFNGVDIVVHAAALKQVPALEYNPFEAVKTNILGSQNVIDAAIDQNVEKVLLISTDKAAQPINLYGSTKLCAEKLFINGNMYSGGKTKFACVRYGNVIGSRGSIVDHLINNPELPKVQITHEKMTRFWITLEQAFGLVNFALENMAGGEIFIPKIPSMNLVDLFQVLAPKAEKEIIGIRPGEKLHEMLLTNEEARHALELENYYVVLPEYEQMFNIKERYKHHFVVGKNLPEDFNFTSNNNQSWLTCENLNLIIVDLKI